MKLTWHGHSCFTLESIEGTVVFDPYKDNKVPGLVPLHLAGDIVLCSHGHDDHNAEEVVALSGNVPEIKIEKIETYHDEKEGTLRGKNTIHIVNAEGMRVVHFGDLGCELTDEQIEKLKNCDAAMICIGGFYTIDADTAYKIVKKIQPRIVIPMHYKSDEFGFDVIGTLEEYLKNCDSSDNVIKYEGNTVEIDKNTVNQTAVLKYLG